MISTRFVLWSCSAGLMMVGASAICGQEFPTRPIRILTSGVGGSSDFASRQIAQGLTESLKQQVIVDNRGRAGIDIMVKSSPDGYNLLLDGASFWITPLVQETNYDPVKDFAPITAATKTHYIIVVNPSLPVKSIKELIALAKAKPGSLNYSASVAVGAGSANRLSAELFRSMAGVDLVVVNYTGGAATAITAVISGEVHLSFATAPAVAPHIKAGGRLRALAISSLQRDPTFPELPTISEAGVPGYEWISLQGLFATARTPAGIIDRLNKETVRVLNRADVKERLAGAGMIATVSSPEEFAAMIKSDRAKSGNLIKSIKE